MKLEVIVAPDKAAAVLQALIPRANHEDGVLMQITVEFGTEFIVAAAAAMRAGARMASKID